MSLRNPWDVSKILGSYPYSCLGFLRIPLALVYLRSLKVEVGNEGLDNRDDIVAYGDDRSCVDYKRALRDELCVKNNKNEY